MTIDADCRWTARSGGGLSFGIWVAFPWSTFVGSGDKCKVIGFFIGLVLFEVRVYINYNREKA